jgi:hypothetical protein
MGKILDIKKYYILFCTVRLLKIRNVLSFLRYKIGIKLKISRVIYIKHDIPNGTYFKPINKTDKIIESNKNNDDILLFGYKKIKTNKIPVWYENIFNNEVNINNNIKWWKIPDYDPVVGDIKIIWELSRYDWVLLFAKNSKNGDNHSITKLNLWLQNWIDLNPPYFGSNWKCGQEASIRIIHLAVAAYILNQTRTATPSLKKLIWLHVKRIEPTLSYSKAQDNNHGTSEAAALFIAGSWLSMMGEKSGEKIQNKGRKLLENRVKYLIEKDGSFSQYSTNYHRLMLDTLCIVEIWRKYHGLQEFTDEYKIKTISASRWLYAFVDHISGDIPNIGANDGAHIISLSDCGYRDYRPTVQLAIALFEEKKAYSEYGMWNKQLEWLNIKIPKIEANKETKYIFDDGGYAIMKKDDIMVVMKYPRYRFRPSHCDALHVDLWKNGENILRDSGTYSYYTNDNSTTYYQGTESHNTIQFDNRDQMPRISRYLFGEWISTVFVSEIKESKDKSTFTAAYRDSNNAYHKRTIILSNYSLTVHDEVSGFKDNAIIRWRLKPEKWKRENNCITTGTKKIIVTSSVTIKNFKITDGFESRYYNKKTILPVLEAEINKPGYIITEYYW